MASNAAPLRDAELASYSPEQLVQLLGTTHLKADFDAVARVLMARESRAAQAEAQLTATLADALRKVQAHEDLRRASIAEAEEDSVNKLRIAEEEARALISSAVAEIHEAGKKMQDEVSAHLDAVRDKLQALRRRQGEDLYASMAMIVKETEAKLKASFSKIHAPRKMPERDGVPSQEMHANTALAVATRSIPVAQQGNQRVGEMVKQGGRAAADASGGITLKRKAYAMENIGVSPVQISGGLEERMEAIRVPPTFNPTPPVSSSSLSHEKSGLCSYNSVSQVVNVSAKVSKELASVEGSGKTATLNEPTPLEKTGGVLVPYAPSEIMQDQGEENVKTPPAATPTPSHNNMSQGQQGRVERPKRLVKPNSKYAGTSGRFDRTTVSKRGRGRGRGHGHGRSNTSANPTAPEEKEKNKNNFTGSHSLGSGPGHGGSNTSANPVWVAHSLNRPSPVWKALPPTVQKYPASLEDGSKSTNNGEAEMNIASGHAISGTMGISHEEGDYGTSSNTGGASTRA